MLGPLSINVEFAEYLIQNLDSGNLKDKAKLILVASKMVLFHAHDLLDLRFLQTGNFSAKYAEDSIQRAILEITDLIQMTLEEKKSLV